MYDRCMDMYVMIPPGDDGASAGKGFMPFLKQCSTYFCQIGGGVFSYLLGHFLREGMKPSPALGKCDQCMNMYAELTSRMISASGSGYASPYIT